MADPSVPERRGGGDACPVCGRGGLPDDAPSCPLCGADAATRREARALLERVAPLAREGKREEALGLLERAQQLAPGRADLARWHSELQGEIETIERLRADFRRCLERERLDLAEHVAAELVKRSPREPGVRDSIEGLRARLRETQFEGLRIAVASLLAERRLTSAAAKVEEAEALDADGAASRELRARIESAQRGYDEARAAAVPLIQAQRWREAVEALRRAESVNVECPDVQEMLRTASSRLGALESARAGIEKALASGRLLQAYDLAAEVRGLDPARGVLEDLPDRLSAALAKYKERLAEIEAHAAERRWKEGLEKAEKLREIEAFDPRLQSAYAACARSLRAIEEARAHLERWRNDPLRFPDLLAHLEVLEQKLPEAETTTIRDLAADLEAAYLARASRDIPRLVVRGRTVEARSMISAIQTFDPAGAALLRHAYSKGTAWRWLIDAGLVLGIVGLGAALYGIYRLVRGG